MLRRTKGPHQPMSTPTLERFTSDHSCNHDFERKTNKNVTLLRRVICTITPFWGYCFELHCVDHHNFEWTTQKFLECHLLAQERKGGVPAQQSDSFDLPQSMVLNLISLITFDMRWSGLPPWVMGLYHHSISILNCTVFELP